eukprot:3353744-Alexandrium_andersonii.AAC.1
MAKHIPVGNFQELELTGDGMQELEAVLQAESDDPRNGAMLLVDWHYPPEKHDSEPSLDFPAPAKMVPSDNVVSGRTKKLRQSYGVAAGAISSCEKL